MKILWITNIPLPEASSLINEDSVPFGGWLVNASDALAEKEDINLSIAFPKKNIVDNLFIQGEKKSFYAFPEVTEKNINASNIDLCLKKILEDTNPDIVHIFGTEYPHTLAIVNLCESKKINTVISIQGLMSICSVHYMAYLPERVQNKFTLRDLIKRDNLKQQRNKFIKRGEFEIKSIKKVEHVIGRTTWDKACVKQINSDVQYHFCNETLREQFYKHEWDINKCEKYSIFISQGTYPIKGLHIILEALPIVLTKFPDTKLYVGGHNITKTKSLKDKLKMSSYGKYIKELIYKNNLADKVIFTGILNESEMCDRYLNSNVFVCPSSIENSPNSLGEAMILGVPCISAYVGGVGDLLNHRREGFVYQADAHYMLAHYICEIFDNKKMTLEFSKNARLHAMKTHDRQENTDRIIAIYKKIISN